MSKIEVHRTECGTVVVASLSDSGRYTYVARKGDGFTVGGSTPFPSPVLAAKFATRLLRRLRLAHAA